MVETYNSMPSRWCFVNSTRINPGHRGDQHAKVQMVGNGLRMSSLCFSTTDIAFQFYEQGLDLPPSTIVVDDLPN
jgi:hypothetical protein